MILFLALSNDITVANIPKCMSYFIQEYIFF